MENSLEEPAAELLQRIRSLDLARSIPVKKIDEFERTWPMFEESEQGLLYLTGGVTANNFSDAAVNYCILSKKVLDAVYTKVQKQFTMTDHKLISQAIFYNPLAVYSDFGMLCYINDNWFMLKKDDLNKSELDDILSKSQVLLKQLEPAKDYYFYNKDGMSNPWKPLQDKLKEIIVKIDSHSEYACRGIARKWSEDDEFFRGGLEVVSAENVTLTNCEKGITEVPLGSEVIFIPTTFKLSQYGRLVHVAPELLK